MEENTPSEKLELQLNHNIIEVLKETAKWAYFLSILGFIFIGFMILSSIFIGVKSGLGSLGIFMTVFYLVMVVIYIFPVYHLFKFSINMKVAINENNNQALTDGFEFLKSHYKFLGIFAIVMIAVYIIMFFFTLFKNGGTVLGILR
jgi:hypothetical protein